MAAHHHHAPDFGRAFVIGISLNVAFVAIEGFYGWKTGSLALLADAAHNLSDVGGLLLAWAAFGAAKLKSDQRHTYGWRRGSIIASFINAVVLLVAMGSLSWEAIQRLGTQSDIDAGVVMVVAGIGVLINGITAWLFLSGSRHDLNIRGAFLHMAADTLVSVGVVLGGALYIWQGWHWIDPVLSLLIALIIIYGTARLFRQSLHLLFDGVPDDIDLDAVRSVLAKACGVVSVHDLHVWAMSTSDNALTAHLVVASGTDRDQLLEQLLKQLDDQFELHHATLQIESELVAGDCLVAGKNGCGGR
ncbi:MAG: cation diffusion facilitator family transporter [Alcanivoracaceae bacterium]